MNSIDISSTIEYTKNLTILYVEDEIVLQTQTKELLEMLFKSVTIANDGVEGLDKYKKKHFDLVITDIKMPNMDGVVLTKRIKEINPEQVIIIISAYDNVNYLVEFINLNINQFIQKPIKTDLLLQTLHTVSKNIVNEKMIQAYRKDLESKNNSLKNKNDEYETLVNILNHKLSRFSKNIDSAIDYTTVHISEDHIKELEDLQVDLHGAVILITLSNHINPSSINVFIELFSYYVKILSNYKGFEELCEKIVKLNHHIENNPQNFVKNITEIHILLESIVYTFKLWMEYIVNNEIKKAFKLHYSIMDDMEYIISIINETDK